MNYARQLYEELPLAYRKLACAQLGRRFIGWERDAAMAALAQRRLAGMRAVPVPGQIEMFG